MNRSDLISRLAHIHPHLIDKDVEIVVRVILDAISDALSRGDRIEIRGFGSLQLNYRQPRLGRNPKSGEPVNVSAKYVPLFQSGFKTT
jgi:integration host factor subunit beta